MPVSSEKLYKPGEALHELMIQETILSVAVVDIQALLRILVDKNIITREEVSKYRDEVRNSPKYKPAIEDIQRNKIAFKVAEENPGEYLKAIFMAKLDGKL